MPGKSNGGPTSPVQENGDAKLNGFFNFDPDDPEYIRDMQRPAVIKEDMNEMERRCRVQQILDSKQFREELEQLVVTEKDRGTDISDLKSMERLSELIMPKNQAFAGVSHSLPSQSVIAIADLRGAEAGKYSKNERILRSKLASLYRLIDLFHWSEGIYNHATLRCSRDTEHILINAFGLLYHEVTASSLIKIDYQGNVIDQGSTGLGINEAGYVLHTAIHAARPDIRCVIHLHTPVVAAVAAMKCGLLPISQEAMIVGPVSYHDFDGIVVSPEEHEALARDLGPTNKIMLLRNHGFVVCGDSLEEAFHFSHLLNQACEIQVIFTHSNGFMVLGETVEESFYLLTHLINACEAQIRAARAGIDNLVIPSEESQKRAFDTAKSGGGGGVNKTPDRGVKWKVGELEWEAWMRVLDNAGFRSGHLYRQPLLKAKAVKAQSDVEAPPSSSAFGLLDETDEALSPQKLAELRKAHEKVRWLNSPNAYQKVELLETGTNDPKKITKWVQDSSSPTHNTMVKIDSPHQFAPITASKEFKSKQKEIKENRQKGNISAGPQSHILEGITHEEAARMKDAAQSGTSEQVMVVGAASKGIIQRQHQHNAQIYKTYYQPNPFANETDEDIERYKVEVNRKLKGETEEPKTPGSPTTPVSPTSGQSTGLTQETTFDAADPDQTTTRFTEKKEPDDYFRRAKSERFYKRNSGVRQSVPAGNGDQQRAATDDESTVVSEGSPTKKKSDKKKKFKTPSFLKRNKKGKKKGELGEGEEEEEE